MDGTRAPLETWESRSPLRLGLGVALREATNAGPRRPRRTWSPSAPACATDSPTIDGVSVTDPPVSPSGIVTFTVDGVPGKTVSAPAARGGRRLASRCRPGTPSGISAPAAWRASSRCRPHVYNDDDDVAALLRHVADIAREATR